MEEAGFFSVLEGSSDPFNAFREVQKAFDAGQDINLADLGASQAGRIQSLQSTFVSITFEEEAAAFWRAVPKRRVTSTVNEYARLNDVAGSIFYEEGGDVDYQADSRDRKYTVVKFMGVKYAVSFPAMHTQFISPAETQEIEAKTRSLVRGMDQALIQGDSSILSLSFDGLIKQVVDNVKRPTQNIIDLRGKRLSDIKINDSVACIRGNYGHGPYQLWLGFEGLNGYIQEKIATKTYFVNAGQGTTEPTDQVMEKFRVANGSGVVNTDVFLRSENALDERIVSALGVIQENHVLSPDVPTCTTTSESTTSAYSLANGDYDYLIVPENGYGLGLGLEVTITHTGGGKRTKFVITKGASGETTYGYRIYRRDGASTDPNAYYLVTRVAQGSTTTTVYDDGEYIPGCEWGFMVDWNGDQVLRFNQLMDMVKLPYGIRADKREGLLRVYGNLEVVNPNKIVLFKNVGKEANS